MRTMMRLAAVLGGAIAVVTASVTAMSAGMATASVAAPRLARSVRESAAINGTTALAGAPGKRVTTGAAHVSAGRAMAPPVFAGYADGIRMAADKHPHPWQGSGHVIFVGCNVHSPNRCPAGRRGVFYDAGALRLDNDTSHTMTVTHASLTLGSCAFNPWPRLHVTVPGGHKLILTQTGGKPPCPGNAARGENFDTSDAHQSSTVCRNDRLTPVFHVTVDGHALTYRDTGRILSTGGEDRGSRACGSHNETHAWARLALPPPPAAHLYWANFGTSGVPDSGTIMRANLIGTKVTVTTLVKGQDFPWGVAVDSSHIYWTNTLPDTIMRAKLNGREETKLVENQFLPLGVAVTSSHLYWTTGAKLFPPEPGKIKQADLNGTGPSTLVETGPTPHAFALHGGHLYWPNAFEGTIMRANLNGSEETTLVTGLKETGVSGIAVDSSHIYWTTPGSGENDGTIMQANLNSCKPLCTQVQTLISGQQGPAGVAVDSSHIYWTIPGEHDKEGHMVPDTGKIMEASLNGKKVKTLVTRQDFPAEVAVAPGSAG